jgi:hypothetical protein
VYADMRKLYVLSILGSLGISACSGEEGTSNPPPPPTTGGTAAGGAGGKATGGVSTGGTSTGGVATGGVATGGVGTGGSTGGAPPVGGGGAGGKATGGAPAAGGGAGGALGGGGAGGGGAGAGGTAAGGGGKGGGGAGGAVGGAGGGGSGGGATATFGAVADLLGKRCASDATKCHGATQTFHPKFNNDAGLRSRLLAAPSGSGVEDVCKSQTLVVPNMPEKSLLVAVLGADDGPRMGCGKRMPLDCGGGGSPCLTDAEIMTIRNWIAAGAPQ